MSRRRHWPHKLVLRHRFTNDSGSASVLMATLAGVMVMFCGLIITVGAATRHHVAVQQAGDLAAVAAMDAQSCAAATHVAQANSVAVVDCALIPGESTAVTVERTVSLAGGTWTITRHAAARPGQPR